MLSGDQNLWILATDADGMTKWQQVTVNVMPANAAPTGVEVRVGVEAPSIDPRIAENGTAGRAIGVLSTLDDESVKAIPIAWSMLTVRPIQSRLSGSSKPSRGAESMNSG